MQLCGHIQQTAGRQNLLPLGRAGRSLGWSNRRYSTYQQHPGGGQADLQQPKQQDAGRDDQPSQAATMAGHAADINIEKMGATLDQCTSAAGSDGPADCYERGSMKSGSSTQAHAVSSTIRQQTAAGTMTTTHSSRVAYSATALSQTSGGQMMAVLQNRQGSRSVQQVCTKCTAGGCSSQTNSNSPSRQAPL